MAELEEVKVDQRTYDKIRAIATRERKAEGEVIRELVDSMIRTGSTAKEGGEREVIDHLKEIYMIKQLGPQGVQGQQPSQQPIQSTNPMQEMMQAIMPMLLMKYLTQPDPMTQVQLMKAMEGGKPEVVKEILDRQEQNQREMMSKFESMFTGKITMDKIDEMKTALTGELQKMQSEKKTDEKLEDMRRTLEEKLKETEAARKSLAEEMKDLAEGVEAVKTIGKTFGLTEKDMTTKEGKIDWGAVTSKVLDTVGKFADKLPVQAPPEREVTQMPEEVPVETPTESTTCPECGFPAQNRAGLMAHMRAKHPESISE